MPLIARQRSRLAVLAVLALVGSLLAVSAVPAVAAADNTADKKAMYSACVGAATEDAGFIDMGNSKAADAANCLAHYGISLGTGDGTTFSPEDAVTRLQMARFLSRAAGPAGIDTMMMSDQMLSDISDLSDDAQDAVNTVASLKIMTPRSDGMFEPSGLVTRADMAVHIAAFLKKALAGPDESNLLTFQTRNGFGDDLGTPPFTDIGRVSVAEDKAIKQIFELGVTTGTTATTFAPNAPVTRGQMALFITRALAHTNARPEGISAQGPSTGFTDGSIDVSVSVRDEDHKPLYDAPVGVVHSMTPDEAFDDDGACVTGAGAVTKRDGDCTLSDGENTDEDGNVTRTLMLTKAGTLTAWVWTGKAGDKFNVDTTDSTKLEVDVVLKPTKVVATDDTTKNSTRLKFGDTVTYTLQVTDMNGDAVAKAGVEVTASWTLADTSDADDDTTGAGERRDTSETDTEIKKSNADGVVEFSFTANDPDSRRANQDEFTLTLTLTLTESGDIVELENKVNDQDDGATDDAGTSSVIEAISVIWTDETSTPSRLSVSQPVSYHVVNDDGVRNVVRATLVDQYGDPVGGKTIRLWSDADAVADGLSGSQAAPAASVETRRNGIASRSYTRTTAGETGAVELIDAEYCDADDYVADTGCLAADGTNSSVEIAAGDRASHYWATRISNETETDLDVLVADVKNKTVVVGTDEPSLATWKADDQFTVDDDNAATANDTVSMADFEAALSVGDTITITIGDDPDDINIFNITTNN